MEHLVLEWLLHRCNRACAKAVWIFRPHGKNQLRAWLWLLELWFALSSASFTWNVSLSFTCMDVIGQHPCSWQAASWDSSVLQSYPEFSLSTCIGKSLSWNIPLLVKEATIQHLSEAFLNLFFSPFLPAKLVQLLHVAMPECFPVDSLAQ